MAENTPLVKTENRGRPAADIDWKKVEDLLMSGCSGAGIAHYLGINPATLYDRCFKDKGIQFSEFSQQKKEKGDEILRAHQYAKALGLTEKGDNTLLIWLGKVRLKQREEAVAESKQVTAVDLENLQMMVEGYKAKLAKYEALECQPS